MNEIQEAIARLVWAVTAAPIAALVVSVVLVGLRAYLTREDWR